MKLLSIVGARPQFIKASALTACLKLNPQLSEIDTVLVHTGQHSDWNMSQVFFDELQIQEPSYNLSISGGTHAEMTGRMMTAIEAVLLKEKPDCVVVYGDTNSTLAASIASAKLGVALAHVEAGLRSFNRRMPEEINRVVADHLSARLYCPSQASARNLSLEGINDGVLVTGDVMNDVLLRITELLRDRSPALGAPIRDGEKYILATIHRAENTNDPVRLRQILLALDELAKSAVLVFPMHPRTRMAVAAHGLEHLLTRLRVIAPTGLIEMFRLERSASLIVTDSGGVQKDAYFHAVPCVTARDETEWTETVDTGWNVLGGITFEGIVHAALSFQIPAERPTLFGDGQSAKYILSDLLAQYGARSR